MKRKKKRITTWFSERQLAQLRETAIRLRNLNRNALSLLQHITFWRLSDKQLIDTCESLEVTVTLMSSALRRRQQLVAANDRLDLLDELRLAALSKRARFGPLNER